MGLGDFDFDGLACKHGLDGVGGVGGFYGFGVEEAGIIELAFVAELAVGIEDEDVWGGDAAVGDGDGLGVAVVEVGEVEFLPRLRIFSFLRSCRCILYIRVHRRLGPCGLLGLMATTETPLSFMSSTSFLTRSSAAWESGQWLDMKAMTRILALAYSARVWVLPSTPGREKSGAASPILRSWGSWEVSLAAVWRRRPRRNCKLWQIRPGRKLWLGGIA